MHVGPDEVFFPLLIFILQLVESADAEQGNCVFPHYYAVAF